MLKFVTFPLALGYLGLAQEEGNSALLDDAAKMAAATTEVGHNVQLGLKEKMAELEQSFNSSTARIAEIKEHGRDALNAADALVGNITAAAAAANETQSSGILSWLFGGRDGKDGQNGGDAVKPSDDAVKPKIDAGKPGGFWNWLWAKRRRGGRGGRGGTAGGDGEDGEDGEGFFGGRGGKGGRGGTKPGGKGGRGGAPPGGDGEDGE